MRFFFLVLWFLSHLFYFMRFLLLLLFLFGFIDLFIDKDSINFKFYSLSAHSCIVIITFTYSLAKIQSKCV